MTLPAVTLVRQYDTHRLIPSRYGEGGASVLARIADDDAHLADIFDLDHATNDRLLAENDMLPGIDTHELVFGLPYYRIVNAAFCHANPLGSRFNGSDRGAWYAAFELETAHAEIIFHRMLQLAEVDWFEDVATYDDYIADVSAELHDIRHDDMFADCLASDSYVASQGLAERLLADGSLGLIYPSVRKPGGTCIACFRPALVTNVRKARTWTFRWEGTPDPIIEG